MREFTKNRTNYRIFDDTTEAFKLKGPTHDRLVRPWLKNRSFCGEYFGSWQEVLNKAKQPNPGIVALVRDMIDELEGIDIPQPMIHKRKPRFREDQGDEIDLDRLRGGQAFWRACERQATVGSQIKTLVINMATKGSVSADLIHWRGAAAIVLCHLLEDAGYQCEILAIDQATAGFTNSDNLLHIVNLKDAHGAIDLDTLTTVISGWFYRSVWFALYEYRSNLIPALGLGKARLITKDDLQSAEISIANDSDLVIIQDVFSEESAKALVEQVLGLYAAKETV